MQNVVFVIATDKEQLQHAIRTIYGSGFDSRLYLDRFFTRSVSLNDTSRKEYLGIKVRNSPTLLQHAGDISIPRAGTPSHVDAKSHDPKENLLSE